MKLKSNFVLRQVADAWVVMPFGDSFVDFNSMLTLNESGMLLWKALERNLDREQLVNVLMEEYVVEYERASNDVDSFLSKLQQVGCVE